jgi:hypothetical protein
MPALNFPLEPGAHASHFFESFGQQKEVVLPFFKEGLANGEHCIYVTHEQSVDDWCFELQAYGIDVQAELERGSLAVITGDQWHAGGDFNSIVKARDAWQMFEAKLADFSGVRIAGDASWALEPALTADQLCHWEATVNLIYEGEPIRAICQYNLQRHTPAALHSALRTHPLAILAGRVYANPYYEAPRILENEPNLNASLADPAAVKDMLLRLAMQPELTARC